MKSLALYLGLLLPIIEVGQTKLSANQRVKVDALFRRYAKVNSPGYGIGIVEGNSLVYSKGYGSANLDYQLPINGRSAFEIASVSKQFTAACIALLIMDGKLNVDMPAGHFILKPLPNPYSKPHVYTIT